MTIVYGVVLLAGAAASAAASVKWSPLPSAATTLSCGGSVIGVASTRGEAGDSLPGLSTAVTAEAYVVLFCALASAARVAVTGWALSRFPADVATGFSVAR